MTRLPEEHIEIMEREGHGPSKNNKLPEEHLEIRDESDNKTRRKQELPAS